MNNYRNRRTRWAHRLNEGVDVTPEEQEEYDELKDSYDLEDYIAKDENSPMVYVGTYGKYNGGDVYGEWLDLTKFTDVDEFVDVCKVLHGPGDHEFMIQDYQNFPKALYSESLSMDLMQKAIDYANLDSDEQEFVEAYADAWGAQAFENNEVSDLLRDANDHFFCMENDLEDRITEIFYESYPQAVDIEGYIDWDKVIRDYSMDYTISQGYVFIN